MCPAPARRSTCSCMVSPSSNPTGNSEQEQKLRKERVGGQEGKEKDSVTNTISSLLSRQLSIPPRCHTRRWEAHFASQLQRICPSCPPQPPSTTSAAGGVIQPRGTVLFAESKLPVTKGDSLLLRSHNTPPFVHSLPNCNGSRKQLSVPTARFGLKFVADNIIKSGDTAFSVDARKTLPVLEEHEAFVLHT